MHSLEDNTEYGTNQDEPLAPEEPDMAVPHRGHTRREFLTAVGAGSAGMLALPVGRARAERPGSAGPFTGTRATRLAMHVHASWSEGLASWETQFRNAAATGIDVLCAMRRSVISPV